MFTVCCSIKHLLILPIEYIHNKHHLFLKTALFSWSSCCLVKYDWKFWTSLKCMSHFTALAQIKYVFSVFKFLGFVRRLGITNGKQVGLIHTFRHEDGNRSSLRNACYVPNIDRTDKPMTMNNTDCKFLTSGIHFPKISEQPQNSWCQESDRKRVAHQEHTNIWRHSTTFSLPGDLARGICAPLTKAIVRTVWKSSVYVIYCLQTSVTTDKYIA